MMKKIAFATAFAFAATSLTAGGMDEGMADDMAEPAMEMEEMDSAMEDETSLLPLILLLLIGAAAAAN